MTQLNLSDDDVIRLLHSLSCAKYKILNKEPNTKTISSTDYFEFNSKFTDKMRRIKVRLCLNKYCSNLCCISICSIILISFEWDWYIIHHADSSSSCGWEEKSDWGCWQGQKICYWCLNCAYYEESESFELPTVSYGVRWAVRSHV